MNTSSSRDVLTMWGRRALGRHAQRNGTPKDCFRPRLEDLIKADIAFGQVTTYVGPGSESLAAITRQVVAQLTYQLTYG